MPLSPSDFRMKKKNVKKMKMAFTCRENEEEIQAQSNVVPSGFDVAPREENEKRKQKKKEKKK